MALELSQFAYVKASRNREWNQPPMWALEVQAIPMQTSFVPDSDLFDVLPKLTRPEMFHSFFKADKIVKNVFKMRNQTVTLRIDKMLTDERGHLHSDTESAFVSGSSELYYLHGVNIPNKNHVLLPAEQIDPTDILREPNVDVRRELIRKKGIEQLLDGLFHRCIDKHGNYELLEVLLTNQTWQSSKFLKMLNPSIGVWHLEGVSNDCATVEAALLWRNNNWFAHADILT